MNLPLLLAVQAAATEAAKEAPKIQPMQPLGWIFLPVSGGPVTIRPVWLFTQVLPRPPPHGISLRYPRAPRASTRPSDTEGQSGGR